MPKTLSFILRLLLVFTVYFVSAKIGLSLGAISGFATLVWAPTGISIAAVFLFGMGIWPAIFLAAFLINLTTGAPPLVALGMGLGNTLEAILALFFLQKFARGLKDNFFLDYTRNILLFIFFGCVISTAIGATVGVISLYIGGLVQTSEFLHTWVGWWIGDMLGGLIFFPLLVAWRNFSFKESAPKITEQIALLITVIIANLIIFFRLFADEFFISPRVYFIFPILLWASLRFGKKVVTLVMAFTSIISVIATVQGVSPFATAQGSLADNLLSLQTFIGMVSIISLTLSSIVSEKDKAKRELEESNNQLDKQVKDRTHDLNQKLQELEKSKTKMLNLLKDLEEERAKDEAIVESIGDGLIGIDQDGKLLLANSQAKRMIGLKSEDIGKDVVKILPLQNEKGKLIPLSERPIEIALSKGKRVDVKGFLVRKDKTRFPISMTVTPFILDGKIAGVIDTFRDITQELKIQETTERQLQHEIMLERKEKDFVSLASHQLLTPLALVSGYISMLISGKLGSIDKEAKKYLAESFQGTERMSSLVKQLLETSRIESGNIKIEKTNFDLTQLALRIFSDLKPKFDVKGLKISLPERKKIIVKADKNQTREVITNILDNAIKYTQKGVITLKMSSDKNRGYLSISDTGIGINKDAMPHIFEKFYLSQNWISKQGESHGLGLYISQLLLKLMGGTITVESKVGEGSIFTIALPLSKN